MRVSSGQGTVKREVWLAATLAVIAVSLVVYLVARPSSGDRTAASTADSGQSAANTADARSGPLADLARHSPGDPLALGEPDAPVTVVYYSDFRCPFCAKFSRDTEPELVDRYVRDGTLRIEWRDFPIFGEQSLNAARAGRAAAAQGKFWEFNQAVFAAAPPTGHPDLTPEALNDFAEQAGMPDLHRFNADMRSGAFDQDIQVDLREAQSIGVSSTPTFVINGRPVLGAQPLAMFTEMIEQAAARP